jgi:hypothetical protein
VQILALIPAIRFIGLAYTDMAKAYDQSMLVIDQAAGAQDPQQLANLAITLQALGKPVFIVALLDG